MIGNVKFFNREKRYGFITGDDDGRDYYFSSREVKGVPSGIIDAGYTVFFTPSLNEKGRAALDVSLY